MGLGGALAAAVIAAWAVLRARRPYGSCPEVSAVAVVDETLVSRLRAVITRGSSERKTFALDVRIRNVGGQPAIINALRIEVVDAVRCRWRWAPSLTTVRTMYLDYS